MSDELVLVQALIALLTVAVGLAGPRVKAALAADARRDTEAIDALDAYAEGVRRLSKRIQSELVFPHLASLATVDPIHDLLYVSPQSNPNPEALSRILAVGQRARELNFGPKQLALWPFSLSERKRLMQELAAAETEFVTSYWQARYATGALNAARTRDATVTDKALAV